MKTVRIKKALPSGGYAVEDCPENIWEQIKHDKENGWTLEHESEEPPEAVLEAIELAKEKLKPKELEPIMPEGVTDEVTKDYTVKELKAMCKGRPSKEWAKLNKAGLIKYLGL